MTNPSTPRPGIYAFLADGDGIVSFTIDNHHMPMVCLDDHLLPKLADAAQVAATRSGKTIRLVYFSNAEELKVIEP